MCVDTWLDVFQLGFELKRVDSWPFLIFPISHARPAWWILAIFCHSTCWSSVGCITALQKPACCVALKRHFRHFLSFYRTVKTTLRVRISILWIVGAAEWRGKEKRKREKENITVEVRWAQRTGIFTIAKLCTTFPGRLKMYDSMYWHLVLMGRAWIPTSVCHAPQARGAANLNWTGA